MLFSQANVICIAQVTSNIYYVYQQFISAVATNQIIAIRLNFGTNISYQLVTLLTRI